MHTRIIYCNPTRPLVTCAVCIALARTHVFRYEYADMINKLRGGGEIWRANMRHFRLCCAHRDSATQESDGGCEGSDAEMIGNGRRGGGAGERDRDLEEDEDEGREERSSESGGGGGFGGWRTHLLGGLTQRVKSWYWGARPLVSFPIQRTAIDSLFLYLSFFIYLLISVSVSHTHAHLFLLIFHSPARTVLHILSLVSVSRFFFHSVPPDISR